MRLTSRSLLLSVAALTVALLTTACDDTVPLPPPRAPLAGAPMAPQQQAFAPPGAGYPAEWQPNAAPPATAPPNAAPPPPHHSVSNAQEVVAAMAHDFRVCYNLGLQEDATMKGSVRITAKIGPEGSVVSATPSPSSLGEKVVACVVARVASSRFSPPEGGGATVVIPVTFASQ
jgi:hypothetical protein